MVTAGIIVLVVAVVSLFVDALRHLMAAWMVYFQSQGRLPRRRRPITNSKFFLTEALQLPFNDVPDDAADRYRRNMLWFVRELLGFAAVILIFILIKSV